MAIQEVQANMTGLQSRTIINENDAYLQQEIDLLGSNISNLETSLSDKQDKSPLDGKTYGLKNGALVELTASGTLKRKVTFAWNDTQLAITDPAITLDSIIVLGNVISGERKGQRSVTIENAGSFVIQSSVYETGSIEFNYVIL